MPEMVGCKNDSPLFSAPGETWPAAPGTYVLVLAVDKDMTVAIGRLGSFDLAPGLYAYVGSACGPGGLGGRLSRHAYRGKRCHWHIDYLVGRFPVVDVYAREVGIGSECAWVRRLLAIPGANAPDPWIWQQ